MNALQNQLGLETKQPVIVPVEDGIIWSKKTDTPRHLHPKHGSKPIGIFHSLEKNEYGYANIGSTACAYVFSLYGFIPQYMAQDLGRSYDMIIYREHDNKFYRVQIKATTQRGHGGKTYTKTSRWQTTTEQRKRRKSEVPLRANQGKQGMGHKNRPHGYDILFAINEEGEFCWWWEEDIKDNKSTVLFGAKNGKCGKIHYTETEGDWNL